MTLFPVFLDLAGQRVVVVGAGEVGLRKARALLQAGAHVTVIDPALQADAAPLAAMNPTLLSRTYQQSDLAGARLAFACTNEPAVNDTVARDARDLGIPCNHASHPERGDLRLGATVRRGEVQVVVSTGAELPHLAQALRDKIEAALPHDLPVAAWAARREAALGLPESQRALVLATLRAEIRRAVGV